MGKDLIIGGASNYSWEQLKYWVNSIKRTDFSGDVVLVATNMSKDTMEKLTYEGVKLEMYGQMQEDGSIKAHSNGAPHVERFFYIWNYLNEHSEEYDFVIATDTRDVVFQSNPSAWIDDCVLAGYQSIIASAEGMRYEDEPWNNQNLMETFGPYFHRNYKGMVINNVGVVAGETVSVRDLFFMIFQMSINRAIPVVDQVVYNILLQQQPYINTTKFTYNSDAWAIQLGTTEESVKSGAGDLGASIAQNPSNMILYETKYFDEQPNLTEDGLVVNNNKVPFVIVHQYDRTDAWKKKIMERYE